MLSRIQKWGNSQGIRIPKAVLVDAQIRVGDEVNIAVREGALVVTPARGNRKRYDLKHLVAKIPDGYEIGETDWGEPVGNEVW